MTKSDLAALANAFGAFVQTYVRDALTHVEKRLAALETRTVGVQYCGVHREGETYQSGSLVTKKGGLWLAKTTTSSVPGTMPNAWLLVVKSGQAER